jgi:hypothetical protein
MEAGAHDLWVSTAEREREEYEMVEFWCFFLTDGIRIICCSGMGLRFLVGRWPLEDAASLVACKSPQLEVEYLKPTQFLAESMSQILTHTQVLRALT